MAFIKHVDTGVPRLPKQSAVQNGFQRLSRKNDIT